MGDIAERMRAPLAQEEAKDEADVQRGRALRLRRSWLRWLRRPFAAADR